MRIIWGYFKERAWFALLLVLCVGLFAQVSTYRSTRKSSASRSRTWSAGSSRRSRRMAAMGVLIWWTHMV